MDSGFYAACTGLAAQTEALDIIAENLANTSTSAYKARQATFQALIAQHQLSPASVLNQAVNNYSVLGSTSQNWQQGNLEGTGNDLDSHSKVQACLLCRRNRVCATPATVISKLSSTNQLVTANGDPVLGQNGAIPIAPGNLSISTDGTVSINGALVGKLRVAR